MLPLNLNANVASASINEVRIISVPTDHLLSRADIERLQSGEALPIEQFKPIAPARFEEPAASADDLNSMPIEELMRRAGVTNVDQG
jgi:hypothetical protein